MPRRSGGGFGGGRAPSRGYGTTSRAPVPAPPAAPAPMMQQPKQPGMMAQMATTAAGVAVGSAVGHVVAGSIMGGGGGGSQEVQAAPAPQQQMQQQPQQQQACQWEVQQFLQCAQGQHDLSLCDGFNEALRQCKVTNGLQ